MERSLSDIICENTDIKSLQKNVFLTKDASNSLVSCSDRAQRPKLDFEMIAKGMATVLGGEYTPNVNATNVNEDSTTQYGIWRDDSKIDGPGTAETQQSNIIGVAQPKTESATEQEPKNELKLQAENMGMPPTTAIEISAEPSMKNDVSPSILFSSL